MALNGFLVVMFTLSLCGMVAVQADEAGAAKQNTGEVAKKLKDALKTAEESLTIKGFFSDDPLTFVNSLVNTSGTLPPWITALAAAHSSVAALLDPTPPSDIQLVKAAMEKAYKTALAIGEKNSAIEPGFPTEIVRGEFKEQSYALFSIGSAYGRYSSNPIKNLAQLFVETCAGEENHYGLGPALYMYYEINFGSSRSLRYFQDSCNYTEIVARSRQITGYYMLASLLCSFCYGTRFPGSAKLEGHKAAEGAAGELDGNWVKVAAKLHEALINIKALKNCLPVFTDAVDSYAKRSQNQDLGHPKFATGLATSLYQKFPWVNWYALSYDGGVDGPSEHSCISGTLSHCIQRKYGRNLFIAGQQAEDNYFYTRNCPAHKDCIATLGQYKSCADATEPFHDCIKTKCEEPAGTICKRKSEDAAVEKGRTASSDGWTKSNFGKDLTHSIYAVAP